MGIEPTYPAWKAGVLPLNYTRVSNTSNIIPQIFKNTRENFNFFNFFILDSLEKLLFPELFMKQYLNQKLCHESLNLIYAA